VAGLFVGLATLDLVYRVAEAPTADRKVQATGQELAAGGPAANAAVTFAALRGGTGAPAGEVVLVTALGRHPLAAVVAEELASRQVTVLDATPDRAEPPAVSSAWVVAGSGERSVVSVNAGGVSAVPPAGLAGLAATAPVLLVDGHHLALAVAAATAARAAGRPVLLDGGSWKPGLDALLPLVDLAACGADFRPPGGPVTDLLDRYGVSAVAVTAGPDPIRWWRRAPDHPPIGRPFGRAGPGGGPLAEPGGGPLAGPGGGPPAGPGGGSPAEPGGGAPAGRAESDGGRLAGRAESGGGQVAGPGGGPPAGRLLTAGEVSVPGIEAVDTLGAGDAFHGALAWAEAVRSARPELPAALGFAARIAAIRCETAGQRRWLADPRLAELASGWLAAGQRLRPRPRSPR
jgi:sugar/nucleoside kinase (ribokinase family)